MGCTLCTANQDFKVEATQLSSATGVVSTELHNSNLKRNSFEEKVSQSGNGNVKSHQGLAGRSNADSETRPKSSSNSLSAGNLVSSMLNDARSPGALKPGRSLSLQNSLGNRNSLSRSEERFNLDDLISIHDMYNILNDGSLKPYILDPFNLLVIDARSDVEFAQHHIVTSRRCSEMIDTSDVSLANYGMIVLYGKELSNSAASENISAMHKSIKDNVACNVLVLKDGYEHFRAVYPFLCTDKLVITTWDRHLLTTYPSVILESCLYQGRGDQATNKAVVDALHITHIVNISLEHKNAFPGKIQYLSLALEDLPHTDLMKHFSQVCEFISNAVRKRGQVLVHCNLGVSRSSACVLAFLIKSRQWTLEHAFRVLKARRSCANPNVGFLRQLSAWEEKVLGRRITNIDLL